MLRRQVLVLSLCALPAAAQPAPNRPAASADRAAFSARCVAEMVAANPRAKGWAAEECRQNWDKVVAAGPMADAIIAAAPLAARPVDVRTLPARLSMVRWGAPQRDLAARGRLGKLDVQVERRPSLNFYWGAAGEPSPYDVLSALRGRGGEVRMIGCSGMGAGEASRTYRISLAGRPPFGLAIYDRMAPTANANSFYNVSMNLSGQVPTLAQLHRDDNNVTATCP